MFPLHSHGWHRPPGLDGSPKCPGAQASHRSPAHSEGRRECPAQLPHRPAPAPHPLTRVARPAVAHDLLGVLVPMARSRKVPLAPGGFGAGAGPALAPVWQPRVPVEARDAPAWRGRGSCVIPAQPAACPRGRSGSPVAVVTPRVVPAAQARARVGVALVCVPVAHARPAAREPPLAVLAAVAAKPEGPGSAGALTAGTFTQAAERPLRAALAGWGQGRAEREG